MVYRQGLKSLFALFLRGEPTLCGGEECVAIDGGKHPVRLRFEIVYLLLTVHYQCECRRLHTSDAQYLMVLTILQRVQSRGVHSQNPVAYSAAQSCYV